MMQAALMLLQEYKSIIQINESDCEAGIIDRTPPGRLEAKWKITPGGSQFESTAVCCTRAMSASAAGSVGVLPSN